MKEHRFGTSKTASKKPQAKKKLDISNYLDFFFKRNVSHNEKYDLISGLKNELFSNNESVVDEICAKIYKSGNKTAIKRLEHFANILISASIHTPEHLVSIAYTMVGKISHNITDNVAEITDFNKLKKDLAKLFHVSPSSIQIDTHCMNPYDEYEKGFRFSRYNDFQRMQNFPTKNSAATYRSDADDTVETIETPVAINFYITLPSNSAIPEDGEINSSVKKYEISLVSNDSKVPAIFTLFYCGFPGSIYQAVGYYLETHDFISKLHILTDEIGEINNITLSLNQLLTSDGYSQVQIKIENSLRGRIIESYKTRPTKQGQYVMHSIYEAWEVYTGEPVPVSWHNNKGEPVTYH